MRKGLFDKQSVGNSATADAVTPRKPRLNALADGIRTSLARLPSSARQTLSTVVALPPPAAARLQFEAFVINDPADRRVFLTNHARSPERALIGHELVHRMRRERRDLYDELVEALADREAGEIGRVGVAECEQGAGGIQARDRRGGGRGGDAGCQQTAGKRQGQ